jgi:hypothetical protein
VFITVNVLENISNGTLLMFIFGTFLVPQLISSKESIALLLMKIKDNNGVPKIRTRRYPGERALGRLYIAVAATSPSQLTARKVVALSLSATGQVE